MTTTIKTDHKWKQFRYGYEVPANVLKSQFEHLNDDGESDDGFIRYRKRWYHLSDFMKPSTNNPLATIGYDAYLSDTYFSGVCIKVSPDGEQYQIATFYS